MLPPIHPTTPSELADALRESVLRSRRIALAGNSSKHAMAGAVAAPDVEIGTVHLTRVLAYEPRDLTISVEAGLPWRMLTSLLAVNHQMVPLDPPFAETATVGGVIAANCSGPRRRLYGTARDLVIGMRFVTVEGKLVQSGGMVVKNVAGLDMAKLMIGSFGTLAAIVAVNFKLVPMPQAERTFLLAFNDLAAAIAARDRVLTGQLQPSAVDLLSPAAGEHVGRPAWTLAIRCGGSDVAVTRYARELPALGDVVPAEGAAHDAIWRTIQEFTPTHLARHPNGAVVRVSCTLKELESVLAAFTAPVIARAGSGVCYAYFEQYKDAQAWLRESAAREWKAVVEFAPQEAKAGVDLWPAPGADFEIMRRVKHLFDPENLLNPGRLYGRI